MANSVKSGNVYEGLPVDVPEEWTDVLVASPPVSIERILSHGHVSPPGFWYCQEKAEFVLVLEGTATIVFRNPSEELDLRRGDWCLIPKHREHRVSSTSTDPGVLWLTVFF